MQERALRDHLKKKQYKDSSNLDARIGLHMRFSTNPYGWMRWVFDQLHIPDEAMVLELGCGPGTLWLANLERVLPSWNVTLSDFSEGMLYKARDNLANGPHSFNFLAVDAQAIPFPDVSFDAVIANHMLYHVPDRQRALAEIRRVLRPGSSLYATTIGQHHMVELDDLMSRYGMPQRLWSYTTPDGTSPTLGFTLENGAEQLASCFSNVEMRTYDDALVVTDAAPLIAYVRSMSTTPGLSLEQIEGLTRFVEDKIAAHGPIHISKSSGIFVAHN